MTLIHIEGLFEGLKVVGQKLGFLASLVAVVVVETGSPAGLSVVGFVMDSVGLDWQVDLI